MSLESLKGRLATNARKKDDSTKMIVFRGGRPMPANFRTRIQGPHQNNIIGNKRFVFLTPVKLPGSDSFRYFTNLTYVGATANSFTLTGNLGGDTVKITVTNYRQEGPNSIGDAVVEIVKSAADKKAEAAKKEAEAPL